MSVRILGLDPGLQITGYAVVESSPRGPVVCEAGVIKGSDSERASNAGTRSDGEMIPTKPAASRIASKRKRDNRVTATRVNKHQARQKSKSSEFRSNSKQGKIITMLRAPGGTTIEAIMKMTGWQQHSVRGFFAGVVRKKLKLNLISEKVDGSRVYRIGKAGAAS